MSNVFLLANNVQSIKLVKRSQFYLLVRVGVVMVVVRSLGIMASTKIDEGLDDKLTVGVGRILN